MDASVVAGGTAAAWTRHKQQQQQPDHDLSHLSSEERECLSFLDSAISSAGGSDYLEEPGTPGDEWDSAAAGGATPWRVNGDDACHVAGDSVSPAAGGQATPGHQRGAATQQQQQQPQPLPRRTMTNRALVLPEPLESKRPPSPGPQHSGPPSPVSQSSGPPSPGSISSGSSSSSSGSQCSGFLSLSVPSSGPPSPRPDSPLSSPQTPRPGTKPPLRIAPAHGKEFNTIIKGTSTLAGVGVRYRFKLLAWL
uniref:WAS/WASL-interacting protein family member 1-like n=1 Tax=Petromyzon marinus TaxID=7757 RepID=A0AAJ7U3I4_PETMA|nr:WAS/WASL-interacting protein family member 1-like [Petromyzon marinus]